MQERADLTEEQKAELAAIRAAREELAARREERLAAAAESKLDAEKRLLAFEEKIAEAEEKHGNVGDGICLLYSPDKKALIIAKRPHPATYRKFVDAPKVTSAIIDQLVTPCLVHPSKAEYDALIERFPAIPQALARELTKLAGHDAEEK